MPSTYLQSIHSNDHTIIAELQKLEQRINESWIEKVGKGLDELKDLYQAFTAKAEIWKIQREAAMQQQRDLVLRVEQQMKADFDAVNAQLGTTNVQIRHSGQRLQEITEELSFLTTSQLKIAT